MLHRLLRHLAKKGVEEGVVAGVELATGVNVARAARSGASTLLKGLALFVGVWLAAGVLLFGFAHAWHFIHRTDDPAGTLADLRAIRGALVSYHRLHPIDWQAPHDYAWSWRYPQDLKAFIREKGVMPSTRIGRHPDSSEVHDFKSMSAAGNADTGGWGYIDDPDSKDFGTVWVNCTHTDASGRRWDSY
ncbi:MAG: hypothetical protein KGL53_10030 [Elusimicrobia bacterium]|nr:hypothetical protein [Elusimicrobiota bacterium]